MFEIINYKDLKKTMNLNKTDEIKQLKTELRFLEELKNKTDNEDILKFLSEQVQVTQSQILLLI